MSKLGLLSVVLVAAAHSVSAQPIPSAGSQLQQIPRTAPQPTNIPEIRVERGAAAAPPTAPGARVALRSLKITGATRYTEAQLISATGFTPGGELDLAGLRGLAASITDFYNSHGFFVAQAYLPAQRIADGVVTIAVIEGRYGEVELRNETRVSDSLARSVLSGLDSGHVVQNAPLERRLLLLSDLPGVIVGATLTPGTAVGTSDLLVNLAPGRRVTSSLEADNGGSRYTGAYRGGGSINFNELTGHGDVASLRL